MWQYIWLHYGRWRRRRRRKEAGADMVVSGIKLPVSLVAKVARSRRNGREIDVA